ncbi:hypothetical protein UFOVP1299_50 [uncultured Caudovirales phage]|uniref:Uncharacterized protein n=1 Tax=uncultured Caudovirales phage TaxID=2100421 RepID=A0A6J5RQR2_9CAUD|nr:hypothetical protein UFOVP1299_50 [uncultured Caudovirales phage]
MTTIVLAYAHLRSRAESMFTACPLSWKGDKPFIVPDDPTPFAWIELRTTPAKMVSVGGVRGSNWHEQEATLEALFMVPVGYGEQFALALAEQFSAVFRNYLTDEIHCGSAYVHTDDTVDDGNYFTATSVCEIVVQQLG